MQKPLCGSQKEHLSQIFQILFLQSNLVKRTTLLMFSGVLQVTDLNDFLGPSQACIKPTEIKKDDVKEDTTLRLDAGTGRYMEVSKDGEEKTLETASVSLNDCLACSGCITSAESVLITSQSHHDLLNALREKNVAGENGKATLKTVVVTLSPQSRASFAAKYNISPLTVHKKLASFFTGLGVDFVFDSSFGRDFSLLESAKEFVERFKRKRESNSEFSTELPMLASACPGWICYAEKTHSYLLPYISVVKSPQQVMGIFGEEVSCQTTESDARSSVSRDSDALL
ncbi:iron hydrogenase [Chytridium lagenaria]|nr:iron hydrogenase [Chytridium lagenaria]